jgi:hypothetical protein
LHTVKHSQGSIDARLRGIPVATHDAKLRLATAHEEPRVAARPVIVVFMAHGAPASVIPGAIPPVVVIVPAVATISIIVPG